MCAALGFEGVPLELLPWGSFLFTTFNWVSPRGRLAYFHKEQFRIRKQHTRTVIKQENVKENGERGGAISTDNYKTDYDPLAR